MELKCSVEEFKQLFKNFNLREKEVKVEIDGEKVGKLITPSTTQTINHLKNHD